MFAIFKFDRASEVIRVFCYKRFFSLDTPLIMEIIENISKVRYFIMDKNWNLSVKIFNSKIDLLTSRLDVSS